MTEAEWLACEDPERLLGLVAEIASERKRRLFSVACCRRIWHLMTDGRSRVAVEVAEQSADGFAGKRQRNAAMKSALDARSDVDVPPINIAAFNSAFAAVIALSRTMDRWDARDAANAVSYALGDAVDSSGLDAQPFHANLLRDVFSFPGHPVRGQQKWPFAPIPALAQAAYDARVLPSGHLDEARLAVLSDALEEAGCVDAEILSHLRSPGPHIRGCWALDVVLGKG